MKERPVRSPLPAVRLPANDISHPIEKALLTVKFKCLVMDSDYMSEVEVKLKEQDNVTYCCIMLFSEENVLTVLVI